MWQATTKSAPTWSSSLMRLHAAVLLLLLVLAAAPTNSRMSEEDFSVLLRRFRSGGQHLSDEHFRLLYEQVTAIFWNSPNSPGRGASGLENSTFSVVVYEVPPFVLLKDIEGVQGDPGNVNQTRTSRNGGLSGIVVDVLDLIEYHTEAHFKYYFPCRKTDVSQTGKCNAALARMANESIEMLRGGSGTDEASEYFGGGSALCGGNGKCFSAGAHKIQEDLMLRYHLTQPLLMTGYRLVTLATPDKPTIFEWASPFDTNVWITLCVEAFVCGLAIFVVEYRADNEFFSTNPLLRLWESMYFSVTMLLSVPNNQPLTHGGRTIVLAQLFCTLILQAVFTGNLNIILLRQNFKTTVDSFQDYTDPMALKFNGGNTICYPSSDSVAKNFLDIKAGKHQNVALNLAAAPDVESCLRGVYTGNVTAAFYDEPIIQSALGTNFMQTGRCGLEGGYCSNWDTPKSRCHCDMPAPSCNRTGACPTARKPNCTLAFTPSASSLTMVGEIFNPVGYALVFPRTATSTDYLAFNQVLQYVKEQGELDRIIQKHVSMPDCASAVPPSTVIKVVNVVGLLICVGALALVGLGVGYFEIVVRVLRKCCGPVGAEEAELEQLEMAVDVRTLPGPAGPSLEVGIETAEQAPKALNSQTRLGIEFEHKAPPVLPLNFSQIPVRVCLEEIRERLRDVEETLKKANLQAGDAIDLYEHSLIPAPD